MHKNFIFDCGNVIRSFDMIEIGLHFFSLEDIKTYLPIIQKDWWFMDNGMPEMEYFELLKKKLPERLHESTKNILFGWLNYFRIIDEMQVVIDTLKKNNRKVYLLSNMPKNFVNNLELFPELKKFDGLVFSCDINMVKPNKEIYDYILNKYNLNPKESLFIDDLDINIKGANSASIDGFVFDKNNVNDFIKYLKENENIDILL